MVDAPHGAGAGLFGPPAAFGGLDAQTAGRAVVEHGEDGGFSVLPREACLWRRDSGRPMFKALSKMPGPQRAPC